MSRFLAIYPSMDTFDKEIDYIIEQVSFVEATIEFLMREVEKHGQNPEIKARIIKEYGELRRLSNSFDNFCDKFGVDDLTDDFSGDILTGNE